MTQSTNSDNKYITDLLVELKSDVKDIKKDVSNIDKRLAIVENTLTNQQKTLEAHQKSLDKIPDLAEKVGELKNWRQIAIIIITGTASTVFGWFVKSR
jgi:predicted ATP-dependent serine protease